MEWQAPELALHDGNSLALDATGIRDVDTFKKKSKIKP